MSTRTKTDLEALREEIPLRLFLFDIVFRDGDEVLIQSRDLKPLDRYFPELAIPLRASLPGRCVVDGEVVIARDGTYPC